MTTPQLSFSVRWLKAHAGVVITASHNPPHDNGFKAYFNDGGQVVPPHDKGIIAEVNNVPLADLAAHLAKDLARVVQLPDAIDAAYHDALASAVLDPKIFKGSKLKAVFTPIHGVGGVATEPMLKRFGVI